MRHWLYGLLLGFLLLAGTAAASRQQETAVLSLVTAVDVGGRPGTIIVDHYQGRNNIIFWDGLSNEIHFF